MREAVGVVLRAPVVTALTLLWVALWWPLCLVGILFAFAVYPLIYPFAYSVIWLQYAFLGRKDKVLSNYWAGWPDEFIGFSIGFPTLKRWLLEGFD